jgi:hypothetical protein
MAGMTGVAFFHGRGSGWFHWKWFAGIRSTDRQGLNDGASASNDPSAWTPVKLSHHFFILYRF